MRTTARTSRRAVTLIELMLAIAVTSMVALGVASMMTTVSSVAESDREARSALLRTHAARESVRAYLEESLAVLQVSDDKTSIAVWLEDDLGPDLVNLFEIRVLRYDAALDAIVSRKVVAPSGWHPVRQQGLNAVCPVGNDHIATVNALAMANMTEDTVLVSGIAEATWALSDETPKDARRARLQLRLFAPAASDADAAEIPTTRMLVAFGLPEHRSPAR